MLRIAVVVADFNEEVTNRLLASALKTLTENSETSLDRIVHVPGCFEIPMAAKILSLSHPAPHAIVCLGAVIQGVTDQNTHLMRSVMTGLQSLQLQTGVPVSCGIISAPNLEKALDRTQKDLDRGREAAQAAIAMANLKQEMTAPASPVSRFDETILLSRLPSNS